MEKIRLNDGNCIPAIGFGVFRIPPDGSTYRAVREALDAGYRHIDTAAAYFNEREVGRAVRESGIPREDIFVTSKLWLQDYGEAAKGLDASLDKLGLDYIDLYLLHQPYGDVAGAWRALEAGKKAGRIRSVGVSNMTPKIWNAFVPHFDTVPAVNQVECNPYFQQRALRAITDAAGTVLEAWGPLGQGSGKLLADPVLTQIAARHGKNVGQTILRFELQDGIVVLPKSTNPERIRGNLDVFDFALDEEEMRAIRALDTGRGSHDPDAPGVGDYLLSAFDVHADD